MATEVGGAVYRIDAKIDGVKRGMAQVKAEFRQVNLEADRVSKASASAMRALGGSIKATLGASGDPAKVAGAWAKATGLLATDMDRVAAQAKGAGISFAEASQRLIYFKDESWRARRGVGDLHGVLMQYDQEAALMMRLSASNAQRTAVLTAALDRQKDAAVRAKIEAAAYGLAVDEAGKRSGFAAAGIGAMGKAMTGLLTLGFATQAGSALMGTIRSIADIGDLAANLGMTTTELQKLQYAFAAAGITSEDSANGLQKFVQQLSDAQKGEGELYDILTQSNVELRNKDGSLRSTTDIILDFAEAIRVTSRAEDQLNMSVTGFGKSAGRQFLEALRDGRKGLSDMGDEAVRTHNIIEDSSIRAADAIDRRYNKLWEDLRRGWQQLVVSSLVDTPAVNIWGTTESVQRQMQKGDVPFGLLQDAATISSQTGGVTTTGALKTSLKDGSVDGSIFKKSGGSGTAKVDEIARYIASLNEQAAALKLQISLLGKSNAEQARAEALAGLSANATDAQREAALKAADAIAAQTNELDYQKNAQAMLAEETALATEKARQQMEAQVRAVEGLADSLSNAAATAQSLGDAFDMLAADAINALRGIASQMISSGLNGLFFGDRLSPSQSVSGGILGGLGSLFDGFLADGGKVGSGRWAVAGERGPELITGPATVTPMDRVSGGTAVHYAPVINVQGGADEAMIERVMRRQQREFEQRIIPKVRDGRRRGSL